MRLNSKLRAATIYAFDVLRRSGSVFLASRRVFAYALTSIPMGVKCDAQGNVYAGCADGVEIWNAGGTILGVIEVPGTLLKRGFHYNSIKKANGLTIVGGVTNLAFGRDGEIFFCAEQTLWRFKADRKDQRTLA